MPLSAEEKNQIAQGGLSGTQHAIASGLGLSAPGIAALALPFLPPAAGLLAFFGRARFPKGPRLEDLINPILDLERRFAPEGVRGRISQNPFIGGSVISTFDQDPHLEELVRAASIRKLLEGETFPEVQAIQRGFVEALAETAQERGFASTVDPLLRGGVFRETAESPLQFVEGDFLT